MSFLSPFQEEHSRFYKMKFLTQWYYVRVPVGFDEIIIGLTNAKNNPDQVKMPLREEADDDSLFFRLD